MRIDTTRHSEPIRLNDWRERYLSRSPLNVPLLLQLLRASVGSDWANNDVPIVVGVKRTSSDSAEHGIKKKQKTVEIPEGRERSDIELVPAYRHIYEFRYSKWEDERMEDPKDDVVSGVVARLEQEENELLNFVDRLPSNSKLFDLGEVATRMEGPSLFVRCNQDSALLVLPSINDKEFDPHAEDYRSNIPHLSDLVYTCHYLQIARKVDISIRATVEYLSLDAELEPDELPFRIFVEVTVSLVCPAIFADVASDVKVAAGTEHRQRRFLNYVFQSSESIPVAYHGDTDIPFLFSILKPAPHLSSKKAIKAMQPAALMPILLPFQRRSVAWLLSREGKAVDEQGRISPIVESEIPLFWDEVELGNRKFYLNRLTGRLLSTAPEEPIQPGASLNEPPGLGKTVECIALMLLNPSVGRNPSIKSWDVEAKIYVKEIKTTLIVTPPALAPQWADELKRHAPSLKVFVYRGWTKFTGPITEYDVEDFRRLRQEKAAKSKKRAKRRRIGSKTASSSRKLKRDQTEEGDYMDVDIEAGDGVFEDIDDEEEDDLLDWCSYINTFDVCITTYPVLQQDLTIARAPYVRPRRDTATYLNIERSRSPLVMCEWYRVIMDEVQMAGGGKIEEMVSLIPRISSFAVSGTPARSQISDLIHVLNFLQVRELAGSQTLWKRLLKPKFVNQFVSLFHRYAIRTPKESVQAELTIPKQTRFLVPIELGRVERHVYDQNVEEALLELGYDARGVAVVEGWQVDSSLLRTWLRKLRGICTHPQVGQLLNQGDKLHKNGVLKSISEVLEGMRDQNWRNFMEDRKNRVQALSRYAQLQQQYESDVGRYQHAHDTLLLAEKEAEQMINDVKAAILDHDLKGASIKQDAVASRESIDPAANQPISRPENGNKGKGKARESSEVDEEIPSPSDDQALEGLPKNPAGEEHAIKRRALQYRLRECYLLLHKVMFLKGDVYNVLGADYSKDEDTSYGKAEELRRRLLKTTEKSAMDAMDAMLEATNRLTKEELLLPVPYLDQGGIRSADLMDEANELIEELLNEQTNLLWQWRDRLIKLLTESLSAESGETDGKEYARTLDTQGEAETFLQAYTALLADRREALLAERTLLAAHDTKEKKKRVTKTSRMAEDGPPDMEMITSISEDVELRPEDQVLQKDLAIERKTLLKVANGRAIKSIMVDLHAVANRISNDKDPEKFLVREAGNALRKLINSQNKVADKLEADLTHFRKAFNDRVMYFRQLQEISDSVAEVEFEGSIQDALNDSQTVQNNLEGKINTLRARQRYLENLSRVQGGSDAMEEDESCILCRSEFKNGYVTQCAHVFCQSCLLAWLARKDGGKICPVCRVIIDSNQLQRFSVKTDQAESSSAPARIVNNEPIPKSLRKIQYNFIDDDLFKKIESIESTGSYGSKIQTLVRHLLYLQMIEPDAKSIIFSAWADSLHIIEHALNLNGIPSLRIDQKKKQTAARVFQEDPDIRVLLLHGERQNAGLNIVCASRVFLVESVVNHAFEIQAIARVDRMGQTHDTEVYCYYAEDTVEKSILDLAARQGLSIYTEENSIGTLNVTNFTLDSKKASVDSTTKSKKGQKGDFIFKTDDMLAILFPHLYEDIEYLIPDNDMGMNGDEEEMRSLSLSNPVQFVNAEAGPSRLTSSSY